jgi:hypothetical protein
MRRLVQGLLMVCAATLAACTGNLSAEQVAESSDTVAAVRQVTAASTGRGITRVQANGPLAPAALPGPGLLSYYGGPVVGAAYLISVDWNGSVAPRISQNMVPFYNALGHSDLWAFINQEYNTFQNANAGSHNGAAGTQQSIGFSSATNSYSLNQPTSLNLTDQSFQTALSAAIQNGTVPPPTANAIYLINVPPNSRYTAFGLTSCVPNGLCGYHSHFNNNGTDIKYAILSDTSVDCAVGCGTDPDFLNNATSVASHEVIESVTDPNAAGGDYPDAWNGSGGEIGDLCNGQHGILKATRSDGQHWVTQLEYDNVNGGCVAPCTARTCADAAANCGTIDNLCGGTISCGTCAAGQVCGVPAINANFCCTPKTTCDNTSCGSLPDGCGGTYVCGCPSGASCINNACQYSSPPPSCNVTQCNEGCQDCNGSRGSCVQNKCVCSSKHACM